MIRPDRGMHGRVTDFLARLSSAPSRVLLLDYDGTVAPFREDRDRAAPYPGVREAVAALVSDGASRVAIVSGRAADDVLRLLDLDPPPEVWGSHGWEHRPPGGPVRLADVPPGAADALAGARQVAHEAVEAARVEDKPVSVAVHTRGLPSLEADRLAERVQASWAPAAGVEGMEIHAFDGGVELRVRGRHKGTAVERILADEPDGAVVAYLGDDRTDEDAFAFLSRLGGRALRVLVRPEPRESLADVWIRPPAELLAFLGRWRTAARRRPPGRTGSRGA